MPSTPKSKNRSPSKQQEKPHFPLPPHDDKDIHTSYTLSSEPAIQRMQRELILLRETITTQNEKITPLERRLGHFDSNIVVLESQLALANHLTDVLWKNWMTKNSTPADHAWLLKELEVVRMKQNRP